MEEIHFSQKSNPLGDSANLPKTSSYVASLEYKLRPNTQPFHGNGQYNYIVEKKCRAFCGEDPEEEIGFNF